MSVSPKVSVKEASDGRKIVHYDGRAFELTPSPGSVICPAGAGTAIHHRKDCTHIQGTEDAWMVYDDPNGDLWRQLLESDYDPNGRIGFAEQAGLRNGKGRPVRHTCETCTLTPIAVGGVRSPQTPLSTALRTFDRMACAERVRRATEEIAQVVRDFPLDAWPTMPLERYALGTPDYLNSFCHRMEFGTPALCSMKGGNAGKHLIYQRKSDRTWHFDPSYANEQEAWSAVRDGFIEAFTAAREGRLTDISRSGSLREHRRDDFRRRGRRQGAGRAVQAASGFGWAGRP
jgi:5-methylcytosine-specific restriction protein B